MAIDALYLVRSLSEETQEYYIPQPNEPVIGTKEGKPVLKIGDGKSSIDDLEPAAGASGGIPDGSEVDLTPKHEVTKAFEENYFAYGTPAYVSKDSNNNITEYIPDQIVSGLAYRFWKDDSGKPGSADYSKNQMLQALGKAAFAVGCNNKSAANYSTTFGSHNINGAYGGFVTGTRNIALGDYSYGTNIEGVEGFESHETDSQYSFMVSRNGTAAADLSFVEGESSKQGFTTYPNLAFNKVGYSGTADEAFHEAWRGLTTKNKFSAALGCFSHVGGMNSVTGHAVSFAFGDECYTGGLCSMAFGKKSETKGQTAFAINHNTKAYGANSFAMGADTKVTGTESFVGGGNAYDSADTVYYSLVSGKAAFGFGSGNIVEADNGVAFGWHNQIDSTSKGTVLLGNSNDSVGGEWSLAAGTTNHIRGNNSVAFGSGCDIFANCGLASGNDSRVHCYGGQALGVRAISYGEGQVAVGRYNTLIENANKSQDSAKAYFIVGIGKDENNTKNGLVVYGDGHAEVGAASTNNNAVVTYKQMTDAIDDIEVSGGGSNRAEDIIYDNTDDSAPYFEARELSVEEAIDTLAIKTIEHDVEISVLEQQVSDRFNDLSAHDVLFSSIKTSAITVHDALDELYDNKSNIRYMEGLTAEEGAKVFSSPYPIIEGGATIGMVPSYSVEGNTITFVMNEENNDHIVRSISDVSTNSQTLMILPLSNSIQLTGYISPGDYVEIKFEMDYLDYVHPGYQETSGWATFYFGNYDENDNFIKHYQDVPENTLCYVKFTDGISPAKYFYIDRKWTLFEEPVFELYKQGWFITRRGNTVIKAVRQINFDMYNSEHEFNYYWPYVDWSLSLPQGFGIGEFDNLKAATATYNEGPIDLTVIKCYNDIYNQKLTVQTYLFGSKENCDEAPHGGTFTIKLEQA